LCALRAREAEPSGALNPARALGRAGAAPVAAALELGGRLRQQADRNSTALVFSHSLYAFPRAQGGAERGAGNPGRAVGARRPRFLLQRRWPRRPSWAVGIAKTGSQHHGHGMSPQLIIGGICA
jgi:hypothetical protein